MTLRLAPQDFGQNEIRNVVAQNLAAAPATPKLGQFYFDTSTTPGVLYTWDGTKWAAAAGPASGDLTGTYPAPLIGAGKVDTAKLADSAVTGPKVDASIKDPVGTTAGLRTLGEGAQQAAAGNDPRLSDKRISPDGSITDAQVAADAAIALSKLAQNPLDRQLHTGTQLASTISDFDTQVRTNRLDQLAKPTTALDINGQRLTKLADPVDAQDAATKAYVDATAQGLDVKQSVRVATTGPVTLSGLQTIDGINLADGQAILVKNQASAAENGPYIVRTGAWVRRNDFDTSAKASPGSFMFVEEGLDNRDSGFVLTTDGAVNLGTTPLSFVQFSGAGQIDAGAGLTRAGNRIDVGGTADRILVNPDTIDIAPTYAGQTSITTLGTVTTGVWNASTIAVARGGTGATDAAGAKANLGFTTKLSVTLAGGATSEVVPHTFNSRDLTATLRQVASPYALVEADIEFTSLTSVTVRASNALPADTYRLTLIG